MDARLRQVLVNLCTNSSRAVNGTGTVSLTVSRDRTVGSIDVTDNGSGIPQSIGARVFDPYITTRKIGEGMGLGLAISRKIMLDHGGDLALVSSSRQGTTFRVTIPRA